MRTLWWPIGETLKPEGYDCLRLALEEQQRRETDALPKAKAVYDGILSGVSVASLPAPERAAPKEGGGRAAAAEHRLPGLTVEKFFTLNGCRAYRTGDAAAWTSDGRLRFRGRTDNQVKLRGLRVELGEIESAINACPDVLTSIVVMRGEENNRFLAGYYTASRTGPRRAQGCDLQDPHGLHGPRRADAAAGNAPDPERQDR